MNVSEDRVRQLPGPGQRAAQEWVRGRLRWERWLRGLEGTGETSGENESSAPEVVEGDAA